MVYAEQGAGDVIQFARFITRLAAMGAQVTAAVPTDIAAGYRHHPRPVRHA